MKTKLIPAKILDRYLRWRWREDRLAWNAKHCPDLVGCNRKLRAEQDRWKVPTGWTTWKELEDDLRSRGQITSPSA